MASSFRDLNTLGKGWRVQEWGEKKVGQWKVSFWSFSKIFFKIKNVREEIGIRIGRGVEFSCSEYIRRGSSQRLQIFFKTKINWNRLEIIIVDLSQKKIW